jgi:hypothetical protein
LEVSRVFWKVPGTFGEVPVFLGSSGCFWELVPGVFGKFRVFWEVPRVFREVPARFGCFRKFPSFGTQTTRFAIIRLQKNQNQKAKTVNSQFQTDVSC